MGLPEEFRKVDGTCCKCGPPTYPPEGFTCPEVVKNESFFGPLHRDCGRRQWFWIQLLGPRSAGIGLCQLVNNS